MRKDLELISSKIDEKPKYIENIAKKKEDKQSPSKKMAKENQQSTDDKVVHIPEANQEEVEFLPREKVEKKQDDINERSASEEKVNLDESNMSKIMPKRKDNDAETANEDKISQADKEDKKEISKKLEDDIELGSTTMLNDNETMMSVSEEVVRIAQQAEETFRNKGCRWDTYFYKVVLAGNVKVVSEAVAYMDGNGSSLTLDWLFQRGVFEVGQEKDRLLKRKSMKLLIIRIFMFIVLTLVNILMTPVFYVLHLLSVSFLNYKQTGISANIQLPMAYAAFSQSEEMVALFLSHGVDIDNIDQNGNNVFHYISDLSDVAPDTAIQIFQNMVKEIDDEDNLKSLLKQNHNSYFLTAVEHTAKFGSPALLTQILKQPNLMHQVPFAASKEQVVFNDKEDKNSLKASTQVRMVDVSMYEVSKKFR